MGSVSNVCCKEREPKPEAEFVLFPRTGDHVSQLYSTERAESSLGCSQRATSALQEVKNKTSTFNEATQNLKIPSGYSANPFKNSKS